MKGKLQASIKRLVWLLGEKTYSTRDVVIRELIQNAYDSITEKYAADRLSSGQIHFQSFANGTIKITDNGMGMNEKELVTYLSTMGETIKDTKGAKDYIGEYGLGFFSSFYIADRVIVETRKAGDISYRWTSDGQEEYDLVKIEENNLSIGTTVTLVLQAGARYFCEKTHLENCIKKYCNYISCSIFSDGILVNERLFPWEYTTKNEISRSLEAHNEHPVRFYKHITNRSLQLDCMLFLSESRVDFQIFSKRMFVTGRIKSVVTDELKFVKAFFNCDKLPLTTSREDIQTGASWSAISKTIAESASAWVEELAAKYADDSLIQEIVQENQLKFQKNALKNPKLFDNIYNLIAFPLANFPEKDEAVTLLTYQKLFKPFDHKIYYIDKKAAAKLSTLLSICRQKNIPVFQTNDFNQIELLRKIANKVKADLIDIEKQGDTIIEEFEDGDRNNLTIFYSSSAVQQVKLKALKPDWLPLMTASNVIYLNRNNPFVNELDRLELNASNKRSVYLNFFKVFSTLDQTLKIDDDHTAVLVKELIHTFKNWIANLADLERLSADQEHMRKWWTEQVSIRDLNPGHSFVHMGSTYAYRCFIVCPFAPKYRDVINQITTTFGGQGILAETAEQIDNISILKKVCAKIDQCDFAVVDISENNPNVMLELGLLIARRIPALIIRDNNVEVIQGIKVPADIISIERIEYANTSEDLHKKLSVMGELLKTKARA